MRMALLAQLSMMICAVVALGCGDTFVATTGVGGAAGSGGATSSGSAAGGQGGSGGQSVSSTGAGPACQPLNGDACNTCLVDSCSETYCKCVGEPDCVALITCSLAAKDAEAAQKCLHDHANSISLLGLAVDCGNKECATCGYKPTSPCLVCEYKKCTSKVNACFSNKECVALLTCLGGCASGDAACSASCNMEHLSGGTAAAALVGCAKSECSECK